MEHVYVFYYTLGEILHFTCSEDDDIETILEEHNINPDDCYWMSREHELKIKELCLH